MRSLNRGSGSACGGSARVGSLICCNIHYMYYTKLVHTVVYIWLKYNVDNPSVHLYIQFHIVAGRVYDSVFGLLN